MDLYLLRHGDAEDGAPGAPDSDRNLTQLGTDTIRAEAGALRRIGVSPELVLTSPYNRAVQTATIMTEVLGLAPPQVADQLACGCRLGDLAGVLEPYRSKRSVMVVGHNPDFSIMTSLLAGGTSVNLKTGGLALVSLAQCLPGAGELQWLVTPEVFTS